MTGLVKTMGKHGKGFTLIEIMVAMTLSLLLTGVMIKVYSGARHTYLLQDGLTRVQEDGRVTLHLISGEVRHAGFRNPVWNDPLNGYTPLTAASANGANGASDTLQIMYMDDTDCSGNVNGGNDPETLEAVALYKRVTFSVDDAESLIRTCEYGASPSELNVEIADQVMIDGVESFQVLYGVDTDFPPDLSINAWTTADNITPATSVCLQSQYLCEAGNLMGQMSRGIPVALKVGVLLVSPANTGLDTDDNSFTVLDETIAAQNDQRLRKTYTTTVALRNLTL